MIPNTQAAIFLVCIMIGTGFVSNKALGKISKGKPVTHRECEKACLQERCCWRCEDQGITCVERTGQFSVCSNRSQRCKTKCKRKHFSKMPWTEYPKNPEPKNKKLKNFCECKWAWELACKTNHPQPYGDNRLACIKRGFSECHKEKLKQKGNRAYCRASCQCKEKKRTIENRPIP